MFQFLSWFDIFGCSAAIEQDDSIDENQIFITDIYDIENEELLTNIDIHDFRIGLSHIMNLNIYDMVFSTYCNFRCPNEMWCQKTYNEFGRIHFHFYVTNNSNNVYKIQLTFRDIGDELLIFSLYPDNTVTLTTSDYNGLLTEESDLLNFIPQDLEQVFNHITGLVSKLDREPCEHCVMESV